MSNDQQLVDALKQTIQTQSELIGYLKAEVERLKSSQTGLNGPIGTLTYIQPYITPNTQPFIPGNPGPWINPHFPYVGSSGGSQITVAGDSLPVGSVQMGVDNQQVNGAITVANAVNPTTSVSQDILDYIAANAK